MPINKYSEQIKQKEIEGNFNDDIIPANLKYVAKMDPKKFHYMPRNIFYKMYCGIIRSVVFLFGPIISWFGFGLKVKGKENIKKIRGKGAIVASNHVHFLDALYLRQIAYSRKMYYIVSSFNNKKGLSGLTLRSAGVLPLATNYSLAKELDKTITKVIQKKHLLTIYPEQALWLGYTKVRPFKKGVVHYAIKNNCPVVPVITLYNKLKWFDKMLFRKYNVTLQILNPVLPDDKLDIKQREEKMLQDVRDEMIECANKFYGCETDVLKIDFESIYKQNID